VQFALLLLTPEPTSGVFDAKMNMRATTTAWKMVRPNGRPSRCLVSRISGFADVVVWNGPSIVLWERFHSAAEAYGRADELWTMLVAHGCEPAAGERFEAEPVTPFRRRCPACASATADVRHRRSGFLVLGCEQCGRAWNSRERTAADDRRSTPRTQPDRRQAA
jgi:hypothetical protein